MLITLKLVLRTLVLPPAGPLLLAPRRPRRAT